MSAIDDTREWSRHVVRWQAMVNLCKDKVAFGTWYSQDIIRLSSLETDIEVSLQQIEKVQITLVEEGW